MTNIKEAIRTEVERRLNEITIKIGEARPRLQGKRQAYLDVLGIIDSLPDEQSSKDLEEAAEEYENNHTYQRYDGGGFTPEYNATPAEAFIAGAEWQKEQDQPITGNSLEQEWLRYIDKKKKECRGELPSLGEYGWLQIARHFANWQKKQMLKDAVERVVKVDAGGYPYIDTTELYDYEKDKPLTKAGDKVKIIIVKEEEQ